MRKLQVLGGYPKKKGEVVIKAVLGVDNTMFLKNQIICSDV